MYDSYQTTLSAAVATNGTFTVAYPTGKSAGSYVGAWAHKLAALQTIYLAPVSYTVSFGATTATITWLGSTTLPAGTVVNLQFDRVGADSNDPDKERLLNTSIIRGGAYVLDLGSPATADADGVSASQSVALGASFLINGALAIAGVAYFDTPRNVVAAWTTTSILTITGKDVDGNTVVEKSASGASHTGKKAFKSISSVTSSASITSATVGTGVVLGLPCFIPDASYVIAELLNGVALPRPAGKVFIPFEIEQTELLAPTAEQIVCPVAGYIAKVRGIVQGAVTTGGPVTVEVNTVAVTGLTFTIADADAAGVRYSDVPTTRHGSTTVVAAGDEITITPGSAINTAGQLNGMLEIDTLASGQLDGTFVAGVTSAATATTGDTRGTYAPAITPAGVDGYQLVVIGIDPANQGVAQYTG